MKTRLLVLPLLLAIFAGCATPPPAPPELDTAKIMPAVTKALNEAGYIGAPTQVVNVEGEYGRAYVLPVILRQAAKEHKVLVLAAAKHLDARDYLATGLTGLGSEKFPGMVVVVAAPTADHFAIDPLLEPYGIRPINVTY